MLTIRLERVGKKNRAQFKIVLQEQRIAPGGAHVEILGSYDPHTKSALLKEDRIKHWLSQGAQPSDTAHNLFVSKGIMAGAKIKVKMPTKKIEESAVTEAPKVETKAEEKKSEVAEDPKAETSNAKATAGKEVKVETAEAPKVETVAPVIEAKKAEKTEKAGVPEEKKEEAPKAENLEIKPVEEKSKAE